MTKIDKENETLLPYNMLIELLRYEYETGLFYWIKRGKGRKVGQPAGCLNKDGYIVIGINYHLYLAHRLAWVYTHGDFPKGKQPFIDHINGKKDDNRITNLRVSSTAENSKNVKMYSRNKSGVNGINYTEKKRPSGKVETYWRAYWYDENGKQCQKSFPINTYGDDGAKQMAIAHRAKQMRLLEVNFGIKYSERHGL